jgi:hypothetical protein
MHEISMAWLHISDLSSIVMNKLNINWRLGGHWYIPTFTVFKEKTQIPNECSGLLSLFMFMMSGSSSRKGAAASLCLLTGLLDMFVIAG